MEVAGRVTRREAIRSDGTFACRRATGHGCDSDGRRKEVWRSSDHRLSVVEVLLRGETLASEKRLGRPRAVYLKSVKSSAPRLSAREGRQNVRKLAMAICKRVTG